MRITGSEKVRIARQKVRIISVLSFTTLFMFLFLCSTLSFSFAATPAPKISGPTSVNFGTVKVESVSGPKAIKIKNIGKSDLTITEVVISGTNAAEFSQTNNCSTITKGGSCTITVVFSPSLTVGPKTAVLTVSSNDPKKAKLTVKLSGIAPPPVISIPKSLGFGKIKTGSASATKPLTIKNTGVGDLAVNAVSFSGTNATEFSYTSECATVLKGKTCTVNVMFTPQVPVGNKSATISVASNDPKKATVNVKLTGKGPSDLTAPSAPQNLQARAVSPSEIDLSWDAPTDNIGVAGYNIYLNGDATPYTTSKAPLAILLGLIKDTNYCFKVSALDMSGNESAESSEICSATQILTPSVSQSVGSDGGDVAVSDSSS